MTQCNFLCVFEKYVHLSVLLEISLHFYSAAVCSHPLPTTFIQTLKTAVSFTALQTYTEDAQCGKVSIQTGVMQLQPGPSAPLKLPFFSAETIIS